MIPKEASQKQNNMRYFLDNFENVHNKEWPFGQYPAYQYYASTGTHIGTDFRVPIGTPIFAPVNGEMFKTEFNHYKGNVGIFIFTHKGIEWGLELCHLRELPQKGQFKEGDIIAYSGMTGEKVDGAHLHAVLHRDAAISKHYQQLTNREQFLRLEKEGAVVDCFKWFCSGIEQKMEDVPNIETIPQEIPVTPVPSVQANTKPSDVNWTILFKAFFDFLRSFFAKK